MITSPIRFFCGQDISDRQDEYKENILFQFQHDRVQQAANLLTPEAERKKTHLFIGRLLLTEMQSNKNEEKLIEVVRHLNEARDLINEHDEIMELSRLNMRACEKAKSSAAYRPAFQFIEAASKLLPEDRWKKDYRGTYDVSKLHAECAYLCGEFETAEKKVEELLEYAGTGSDKAQVYLLKTVQHTQNQKRIEAIDAGLAGLHELGMKIPKEPDDAAVEKELCLLDSNLGDRKIADLIDLPLLSDPEVKMQLRLLIELVAPACISGNKNLFTLVNIRQVNLSLKHGNAKESAFGYVGAGSILNVLGDLRKGYEFGTLAVELNEKLRDRELRCKILHMYAMHILPFNQHRKTMKKYFRKVIDAGYSSGDFIYMSYDATGVLRWDTTIPLDKILEKSDKYISLVNNVKCPSIAEDIRLFVQYVKNVTGRISSRFLISDEDFSENEYLKRIVKNKDYWRLTVYYMYMIQLYYLYNNCSKAIKYSKELEKYFELIKGTALEIEYELFSSLLLTALLPTMPDHEKGEARGTLTAKLEKFKKWSDHCPVNFLHIRLLLEAETAKLDGSIDAFNLYDQAITAAKENEYPRDEAIANECAAKHCLSLGMKKIAGIYLADARYCYTSLDSHSIRIAKVLDT